MQGNLFVRERIEAGLAMAPPPEFKIEKSVDLKNVKPTVILKCLECISDTK